MGDGESPCLKTLLYGRLAGIEFFHAGSAPFRIVAAGNGILSSVSDTFSTSAIESYSRISLAYMSVIWSWKEWVRRA